MNTMKTRLAGVGVALVAATVPLGMAAPAQATAPLHDGCTLTAAPAEFRGTFNAAGLKEVYYPYTLFCLPDPAGAGVSVQVTVDTREQDLTNRAGDVDADGVDNADEDVIGTGTSTIALGALGGTVTRSFKGVLPRTDTDGNDEVYGKYRFRVTSGFVTGSWSAYDLPSATRIWW